MKYTWFTGPTLAAGLVLLGGIILFQNVPRAMPPLKIRDAATAAAALQLPALDRLVAKHVAARRR